MDDLSGRVIKTYELQERIGIGGFGVVYRAYQKLIGREVAIKIILPEYANKPDFIRRFEVEAQLIARLEHPHIVPLYDYWREPSGAYLVMRWLRGGSIQDLIKEKGALDLASISKMLTQISEALIVAHRQGVVHRDLKPENILLDTEGNAYLSDFGIAKDLTDNQAITQNNAILGSPAYLSPEQIKGESVTAQSDIYAMGIVLYEMLTGKRPYEATSPATLMYKHLSEQLPDINTLVEGLPAELNLVLSRATAKDPTDRYENILDFARGFRHAIKEVESPTGTLILTSSGVNAPAPENPYKGLRAFQQYDASDFFGREGFTLNVINRLLEEGANTRFLAVVGPSGSGKSSVVKAGVLPALRDNAIPGSKDWFIIEMLPGLDPMEELEAALLRIAVNPPESLLNQLMQDERGLIRALKRVLPEDETELLLFIDQFEELFTLVDEEHKRTHFMDSLIAAISEPRSRLRVIITLRADFYDKPLNYNRFGELMRQRTEIILPLNTEELERAISAPAKRANLVLEDGLVTTIVADVNQQPGALPLLQYALTELFERRNGIMLTLEAYNDIGGTMGALARRADELYEGLGDDGQKSAKQLFLRLVTLGEGTEDTRRRVLQSELLSIGNNRDEMELVIEAFGRYRLLTFDHDPQTRSSTVEVAHEALIRQWGLLREWLNTSREDLRTQRRLTASVEDWENSRKDPSFLLRGLRLEQIESWRSTSELEMNAEETDYVRASIAERERLLTAERERQTREELLEKRSEQRLRALVIFMTIAALVGIGLAIFAFSQSQEAQIARHDAEQNALEAQTARDLAEQSAAEARGLALAANARNELLNGDSTLSIALATSAESLYQPAPVEVKRILASSILGAGVKSRYEGHTGAVLTTTFSNDGRYALSASADGTVRIWENATHQFVREISLGDALITRIAYHPTEQQFVVGTTLNSVILFSLDGEEIRRFEGHTDMVTSLAFSGDGTQLLTGSLDRTLRLWDVATGDEIRVFEGHIGVVLDVDLSKDGKYAVSSSGDETIGTIGTDAVERTVRVWDVATGETLHEFKLNSGFVRAVAISPDSKYVVAGSWDGSQGGKLTLWDMETGEEIRRFFGHSNIVTGITFSPDGKYLYSSSWDSTLRVWDFNTAVEIARYTNFEDRLLRVSVSPDGQYALVASGNLQGNEIQRDKERSVDTSVWLMDLQGRAQINTISGFGDWAWAVAVDPTGEFIATSTGPLNAADAKDTTVRVYNRTTSELVWQSTDQHTSTVEGLAYSHDGQFIATADWNGTIVLWDAQTGEEIRRISEMTSIKVLNLAFSPDDTLLASANGNGTITLWNVETGDMTRQFGDYADEVVGLAFHPSGESILAGDNDGVVKLWNVATGEKIRDFVGHTNRVNELAFSPDGNIIASAAWDSTIRLWDATTGRETRKLIGHVNFIQTVAFNQTGTLLLSGGADTTVRLWDVASGEELFRYDEHSDWVSQVAFIPNSDFAVSSGQDKTLRVWRVMLEPQAMLTWAGENRYLRELTCGERTQFRVEPYCETE
jgi:WD40 repeat protein/serine/threonine protein kinase